MESTADPMATVRRYIDCFNKSDVKGMAAACDVPMSILDGLAPHVWHGPTATEDWHRDVMAAGAREGSNGSLVATGRATACPGHRRPRVCGRPRDHGVPAARPTGHADRFGHHAGASQGRRGVAHHGVGVGQGVPLGPFRQRMTPAEGRGPHQARPVRRFLSRKSHAGTRRHPTHPTRPGPGEDGALRVPHVPRPLGRPELDRGPVADSPVGRRGTRLDRREQPLGDPGVHLERFADARARPGVPRLVPRGVPARDGRPCRDPRRHGRESPRPLGGGPGQPGPPRHRHPLRPRRRRARALQSRAPDRASWSLARAEDVQVARPRRDPASSVRTRPFP